VTLLREGQVIRDTYSVDRLLGAGAFAEVYRVQHRYLGRQAMKVFRRVGMSGKEIESALGEAILLSRIGHPNIVRVFDANTVETPSGVFGFFTMEYVPGGTLDRLMIDAGGRFVAVPDTVEIMCQVCRGIAVAHSGDPPIIHRDIKPQNLLVGTTRRVFQRQQLSVVVAIARLENLHRLVVGPIDQPVLVVNAAGPVAGQVAPQGLALDVTDQSRDPRRHLPVRAHPVQEVLPGIGIEMDAPHYSPARSCSSSMVLTTTA
jgi:serine/threonine protein kinase